MTESLFSSINKLNNCKDSVGENCVLRSKKRGSRTLETRASCPIVTCLVCVKRLKPSVHKVVPG